MSVYSTNGEAFYRDGEPVPGVRIEVKKGRYRYVSSSGKLLASGLEPRRFAEKFWFASEWSDTENAA